MNNDSTKILEMVRRNFPEVDLFIKDLEISERPVGHRGDLVLRVPDGDYSKAKTLYIPCIHGNAKQVGFLERGSPKIKVEYYHSIFNVTDAYSRAPDIKLDNVRKDRNWNAMDYYKATHYLISQGVHLIPIMPHEELMGILWKEVAKRLPKHAANQLPYFNNMF